MATRAKGLCRGCEGQVNNAQYNTEHIRIEWEVEIRNIGILELSNPSRYLIKNAGK